MFLFLLICFSSIDPSIGKEFELVSQFRPPELDDIFDVSDDGIYIPDGIILNKYDFNGKLISRNITDAYFSEISVSQNGEYICGIETSYSNDNTYDVKLFLLDKANNILWTKDVYTLGAQGAYFEIDVSNHGNIIYHHVDKVDGPFFSEIGVFVYDKEGNKIWSYKYEKGNKLLIGEMTITSLSDINFAILNQSNKEFNVYDFEGELVFTENNVISGDISPNGKYIIISNPYTKKYDSKGNLLKSNNELITTGDVSIGDDGYIIERCNDEIYILNDNLDKKMLFKSDDVLVSPSGDYIIAKPEYDGNNLLIYSVIRIPKEYPSTGEIVNTNLPTFQWKGTSGSEYIIKIDGKEYTTRVSEFTPSTKLSPGKHTWSVKQIGIDGKESSWSSESSFVISTNETMVTETTFVDNPITFYTGVISIIMLAMVGMFFVRPYYKRAKLKRGMAKTATDWCPNCHKFTGGANICPHCGKDTLIEIDAKKISEKIKSKKK